MLMKTFKSFIQEDDIDSYENRMTAGLGQPYTPYGGGRFGGGGRGGSSGTVTGLGIRNTLRDILSKNRVGGVYKDDKGAYSVNSLIKRTSDRTPESVPVKDVIDKNKTLGTKEGNFADNIKNPTAEFKARTDKANTQYPIMTDKEGYIVDGSHRAAKTAWQNPDASVKINKLTDDDFDAAKIRNPVHMWLASRVKK
jgi:hypothetical protein